MHQATFRTTGPSTVAPRTSPSTSSSTRPSLPDRAVTSSTITSAFVQFILHCNPAVPTTTDTTALQEAFQTPPKSGGKSFNVYLLYQLIEQLEAKEVKTWAELALKLGVEPPDTEKGESSQKIQQYAVRLKRWMHSMHVDAFFEYLLGGSSREENGRGEYWKDVPAVGDVLPGSRDGVAAEDDMALRALMPEIKPKRGRRGGHGVEGEDMAGGGMEPPPLTAGAGEDMRSAVTDGHGGGGWSAHPAGGNGNEGRGSVFLFPAVPPSSSWTPGGGGVGSGGDMLQTPLTAYPASAYPHSAYPQSAITPSTRQNFWADEPRSAITPSKLRMNKRHGAKVVSSAWRSGLGGSGKTRGRPKINRGDGSESAGPFSAFPSSAAEGANMGFRISGADDQEPTPISALPTLVESPVSMIPGSTPTTPTVNINIDPNLSNSTSTTTQPVRQDSNPNHRPVKRSRLSLQVPERVGGEVRLATPPPVVMVNGQQAPAQAEPRPTSGMPGMYSLSQEQQQQQQQPTQTPFMSFPPPPASQSVGNDTTDPLHLPEIEGLLTTDLFTATWFTSSNTSTPPCDVEEASSVAKAIIDHTRKTSANNQAFLVNIAALMGAKSLGGGLRITKFRDGRYRCEWELRLGGLTGGWSLEVTIAKNKDDEGSREGTVGRNGKDDDGEQEWKKKYTEMCEAVKRRDKELAELKGRVTLALRDPGG